MQRTSAATCSTEAFDLDFDLQVHCTLFDPGFMQSAPLFAPLDGESKEEKKEEKEEKEDIPDDLDDDEPPTLSSLSLSSPISVPGPTWTCLNPHHVGGHTRASTCL